MRGSDCRCLNWYSTQFSPTLERKPLRTTSHGGVPWIRNASVPARSNMTEYPDTAVVAGVGSGLGKALCRRLAEAAYRVCGLARGAEASWDLAAGLGPDRFLAVGCDVTDAAQVDAAIGKVEAQWGPVTVYVHNAAPFHTRAFPDTDPTTFESLWRTMCLGAVSRPRRAGRHLCAPDRAASVRLDPGTRGSSRRREFLTRINVCPGADTVRRQK
jgi:hypothetical protein